MPLTQAICPLNDIPARDTKIYRTTRGPVFHPPPLTPIRFLLPFPSERTSPIPRCNGATNGSGLQSIAATNRSGLQFRASQRTDSEPLSDCYDSIHHSRRWSLHTIVACPSTLIPPEHIGLQTGPQSGTRSSSIGTSRGRVTTLPSSPRRTWSHQSCIARSSQFTPPLSREFQRPSRLLHGLMNLLPRHREPIR